MVRVCSMHGAYIWSLILLLLGLSLDLRQAFHIDASCPLSILLGFSHVCDLLTAVRVRHQIKTQHTVLTHVWIVWSPYRVFSSSSPLNSDSELAARFR
jgi:hypothetical protein